MGPRTRSSSENSDRDATILIRPRIRPISRLPVVPSDPRAPSTDSAATTRAHGSEAKRQVGASDAIGGCEREQLASWPRATEVASAGCSPMRSAATHRRRDKRASAATLAARQRLSVSVSSLGVAGKPTLIARWRPRRDVGLAPLSTLLMLTGSERAAKLLLGAL